MVVAANIAVSNTAFSLDKLYAYKIPPELSPLIKVGTMVLVPFGRGDKARMGVVLEVFTEMPNFKNIKEIYDATTDEIILTPELLELAYFLKERTFCTHYEAVKTIIPHGAQYKPVLVGNKHKLQKQIVNTTSKYYKSIYNNTKKITSKQKIVIDYLKENTISEQEILVNCNVGKNVLDRMVKNALLEVSLQDKKIKDENTYQLHNKFTLSPKQNEIYTELCKLQFENKPKVSLLRGVTSSGKTLIFLKLIENTINNGKKAIVLVPEIALTSQMVERFKNMFGDKVAVQHSALSHTERLLQWQQIQKGKVDIVVGTRSAIFAPIENIGVIIIDEEQEHTYFQEMSPRFSAIDVAKKRVVKNNALLLLASATPSIESYYNAVNDKYKLLEIDERYGNAQLPIVEIVDMQKNLLEGNTGILSLILRKEISYNLNNNEQTILLLNRRGYQTVAICENCAKVVKCENCTVPMVYHKNDDKLLCHHCNCSIHPAPINCSECGGKLKYTGFGTQKIQEDIENEFKGVRVLRMDQDTITKKNSHHTLLTKFKNGEYDILIGTQMVAKGLDFEKVSLVGVIGIDNLLLNGSYKAFENVFSLITQVVGRSGRSKLKGRAVIQTLSPDHPVISLAATQDYKAFYNEEILFRKMSLYPPYCHICIAGFVAEDENLAILGANEFSGILTDVVKQLNNTNGNIPIRIIGPSPFNIIKVNNKYRYKLTIKCKNNSKFRQALKTAQEKFKANEKFVKINIFFDFNQDI